MYIIVKMSNHTVTYHISASLIGAGYSNIDTFYLYTGECGVPGEEYTTISKTDLTNGFSIVLEESVQYIYLTPFSTDEKSFHCRLGCNSLSASLALSGYVVQTPEPTTPEPTTPEPITPNPTPQPTTAPTPVPTPSTTYTYTSLGTMTLNKTSISSLEFIISNPSSFARNTAATSLAYFFAGQSVAASTDVDIRGNTHVFTSDQSSLQDPNCSYLYLDVGTYTQIGSSYVRWFDQPAQEYAVVRISDLSTLPSNLQNRTDGFLFLYTTNNICP